ncbi:hypothetical protein N9L47_13520 [Rhodobacteraceae bacterium]|nr:hypothetical protein [Paracoccaceae bacterium]
MMLSASVGLGGEKLTRDSSLTTAAQRLLPALAQSNPLTAGICRLYDDQRNAERELNLARALQVIEHRLSVNKDEILSQKERLAALTNIVRAVPVDKSELHSTICAKLAASGFMNDEEVLARYYISRLSNLDYLEILVLFGEAGVLTEKINVAQRDRFFKNSPEQYRNILDELVSLKLLDKDSSKLSAELDKLL